MADAVNVVFPRKLVKEFITLYQNLPCLWDKHCISYKMKHRRHEAITKMTQLVQEYDPSATRVHVLRKIESLRACVRREHKRVLHSKKITKNEEDIYTPHLWYYDLFSFMFQTDEMNQSYDKSTGTTSSPQPDEEDREVTEEDFICEACFYLAMQSVNDELHGNNDRSAGPSRRGHKEVCLLCGRSLVKLQSHLILSVTTSLHHNKTIQIVESRIAPRQESEPEDEPLDNDDASSSASTDDNSHSPAPFSIASNIVEVPESTCGPAQTSTKRFLDEDKNKRHCTEVDDEYDAIGVNVAAKLRNLPENMRILAEKLINDVLYQAQTNGLSNATFITTPDPFKI